MEVDGVLLTETRLAVSHAVRLGDRSGEPPVRADSSRLQPSFDAYCLTSVSSIACWHNLAEQQSFGILFVRRSREGQAIVADGCIFYPL